jgi:hypothetical protein
MSVSRLHSWSDGLQDGFPLNRPLKLIFVLATDVLVVTRHEPYSACHTRTSKMSLRLVMHHVIKSCGRLEVMLRVFLTKPLGAKWMFSFTPRPLYTQEMPERHLKLGQNREVLQADTAASEEHASTSRVQAGGACSSETSISVYRNTRCHTQ